MDPRDLILPSKLERQPSIGLRREGEGIPRLEFGTSFETQALVGEIVPRGSYVAPVPEPPVEPRVLLDEYPADHHGRCLVRITSVELDGIERLHGGLQSPADVYAVVPGHELMDPHRPVRGGEEREAGDGGPRDVLAVVLAPARSRVQNLRGKGRRIQGREG